MSFTDYFFFKTQFTCEYEEEYDYFLVSWKDENEELIYTENSERIVNMDNDCNHNYTDKNNMFWIDDIKKHYNWKLGDCIYLNVKQNCDNCFYVMRGWGKAFERKEDEKHFCVAIDEDGFVLKRYYQHYARGTKNISYDFVARPNCVYNDYLIDYPP
tara:strand:+ start:992 stop:1462 length:471 start_codon:yes stop_codon:yes gene_type:complete